MYVFYYFGEEYKTSGLNDTFKKTTLTLGRLDTYGLLNMRAQTC